MIYSVKATGLVLYLIVFAFLMITVSCARQQEEEQKEDRQEKGTKWVMDEKKIVLEAMTRYRDVQRSFREEQQATINASQALLESHLSRLKQSTGPGTEKPGTGGDVLPCLRPNILAVHPDNQVRAGGEFLIEGECFGDMPGEMRLIGGPFLFLPTEIIDWSPNGTHILARVLEVAGIKDHEALVMVKNKDGETSNKHKVNFFGKKKIISMPQKSAAMVSCGDDGNQDQCNDWIETDGTFVADQCTWVGAACGYHYNTCGAVGDDTGTDVYEIDLQNGWKIHDYWLAKSVNQGQGDAWVITGSSPVGTSYWTPQIGWSVTPCDGLAYALFVFIEGPVGLPFQ